MFTKSKIAAIALTSSLVFASTAQAEEISLEKYVTNMVTQAMTVAQQELKNSVRETVLNTAHNVSFEEEKTYVAKVTIKDLNNESENVEAAKTAAE